MLDPEVDLAADMAEMASGNYRMVGEDLIVNGRTYGYHAETGTVFPKHGPGIKQFSRMQHHFIKKLNAVNFEDAMKFAQHLPGLDEVQVEEVLELWRKCR